MKRRALAAAWRRTGAVWRVTLRDVGVGCGGGLLVGVVVAGLAGWRPVRGALEGGSPGLAAVHHLEAAAWLTAVAVLLCGAWSVAEDRRSGRLAQWLATPLRTFEYSLAKSSGVLVAGLGVALPLQGSLLWLDLGSGRATPGGWPPSIEQPRSIEGHSGPAGPAGASGIRSGPEEPPWVLRPGGTLGISFAALPDHAEGVALQLTLAGPGYERAGPEQAPRIRIRDRHGRPVLERSVPELPGIGAQVLLPAGLSGPLSVEIEAGGFTRGALVLRPGDLFLAGDRGALLPVLARGSAGLGLLVTLCAFLSVGAAVLLPDVLAFSVAAVLCALALGRELLLAVCGSIERPSEQIDDWVQGLAGASTAFLELLPDLDAVLGIEALVRGHRPPLEAGSLLALAGWSGVAFLLGSLGLWRRRGCSG
jgi:hypothetical protein